MAEMAMVNLSQVLEQVLGQGLDEFKPEDIEL
jgi:hypothetical protein